MKQVSLIILTLLIASMCLGQTQPIRVLTPSMEPTFHRNDFLVVDYDFYHSRPINRFDVIVFQQAADIPGLKSSPGKEIARVIGIGGEIISIKKNKIYINDVLLQEPFKTVPCSGEKDMVPCGDFGPLRIPDGEVFLLADNRPESADSRMWKPPTVRQDKILGKVTGVIPATLSNKRP